LTESKKARKSEKKEFELRFFVFEVEGKLKDLRRKRNKEKDQKMYGLFGVLSESRGGIVIL
jgi:hypothetical protein